MTSWRKITSFLRIWKLLQCVCGNIFYKFKNPICTQLALVPALIDKIGHFPPKKSKNRHFGINYDVIVQNGAIFRLQNPFFVFLCTIYIALATNLSQSCLIWRLNGKIVVFPKIIGILASNMTSRVKWRRIRTLKMLPLHS